jgi:hypothetical protein
MHLSSGLRAESVQLEFAAPPPGLADARSIGQQSNPESVVIQLLRTGLQWALAGRSQVDLLVETPQGGYALSWESSRHGVRPLPAAPTTRVAVVRARPAEPWWKVPLGRAQASLGWMLESRWRLAYCPVPTRFDGLCLSSGLPYHLPEFRKPLMVQQMNLLPEPAAGSFLRVAHPCQVPAVHYVVGEQVEERPFRATPVAEVGWMDLVLPGACQLALRPDPAENVVGQWTLDGRREHVVLPGMPGTVEGCCCSSVFYYQGRCRDQVHCQRLGLLCDPVPMAGLQTEAWNVVLADDEVQVDPTGLTPIQNDYLMGKLEWVEKSIDRSQVRLGRLQTRYRVRAPRPHS